MRNATAGWLIRPFRTGKIRSIPKAFVAVVVLFFIAVIAAGGVLKKDQNMGK
jgi:hypothetical protein